MVNTRKISMKLNVNAMQVEEKTVTNHDRASVGFCSYHFVDG